MEENKEILNASPQPAPTGIQTEDPNGINIGGWLILFAIGIVITPFRVGFVLYQIISNITVPGVWQAITTPGMEAYHPLWQPIITAEIGVNTLIVITAVFIAVLFFLRKKIVPLAIIIYLLFSMVFVSLDYIFSNMIPAVSQANGKDMQGSISVIQAVGICLIWVPYFIISKRVKKTFVK